MEKMIQEYSDAARDAGVLLVSSCGFDSIPNDLGALYVQRHEGTFTPKSVTLLVVPQHKRMVITVYTGTRGKSSYYEHILDCSKKEDSDSALEIQSENESTPLASSKPTLSAQLYMQVILSF